MTHRLAPEVGARLTRAAEITPAGNRKITFVASDETVDRYGDIVRASGWNLADFRRNPVLLWAHNSSMPPIGNVPDIRVEGTRLIADAEFMPKGMSSFADGVWEMVDAGFIKAVSVGFMPTEQPKMIRDPQNDQITGFEFTKQDLFELSVVPVPANPNALALAKSLQLDEREVNRLFNLDHSAHAAKVAAEARHRSITLTRLGRH